jgi:hypothetical protein
MAVFAKRTIVTLGEPLWLSGKVVKNEKINEIERTLRAILNFTPGPQG